MKIDEVKSKYAHTEQITTTPDDVTIITYLFGYDDSGQLVDLFEFDSDGWATKSYNYTFNLSTEYA